jgi:hypothetical protein
MAPQAFDEYMAVYGPTDGDYPVIDLDTGERRYSCLVVTFADGAKKAVIDLYGIAAGEDAEHLCIDVHAFVDDQPARSGVFGLEDGRRFQGFEETAPGRSHGWPAVRGVSVLIGAQAETQPQP